MHKSLPCLNFAALAVLLATFLAGRALGQDYHSDPQFQKTYSEAQTMEKTHQKIFWAVEAYKKANKKAGGKCTECLQAIITLGLKAGDYKDTVVSATELEQLAASPQYKATAETWLGTALFYSGGDHPKPDQLTQADQAFKAAIAHDPAQHVALYLDGRVLACLGQDDAAREQFNAYIHDAQPKDAYLTRARHFAEDPALARAKMAPAFTVVTAGGKHFSLDDMKGKVVLIDFWATWCGPCNAELPHMHKIAQEFAGQPFEIISVSWDTDANKWQQFITKNEMTWNQYRDADHKLSENFGVNAIPHYFTIDSDGVLQAEKIGSGSDIEGKIKKLIARANAASSVVATASDTVTGIPTMH